MRIVAVSDLHHKYNQCPPVPDGDVLVVAGDLTGSGTIKQVAEAGAWLRGLPHAHKVVIPGNHDWLFEKSWNLAVGTLRGADTRIQVLNQTLVEIEGVRFYGEPRTPRFFDWAFNVDRHKMGEVWGKIPPNTDVLVSHGPPHTICDRTQDGHSAGCGYLKQWVDRADNKLVICGHIHEGYGAAHVGTSLVVNASICNRRYALVNPPIVVEFSKGATPVLVAL